MTAALWDGSVPAAATAVVKRIESFSGSPYDDNGPAVGGTWTYGWGATRDLAGAPVTSRSAPIDETIGQRLLERDMQAAVAAVRRLVQVILRINEAAALISWVYNLGEGNFAASGMLRLLNEEHRDAVPGQMRVWINVAGTPSLGLLRRRWAEAAIFVGVDAGTAVDRAWAEITALGQWPEFGAVTGA